MISLSFSRHLNFLTLDYHPRFFIPTRLLRIFLLPYSLHSFFVRVSPVHPFSLLAIDHPISENLYLWHSLTVSLPYSLRVFLHVLFLSRALCSAR